MRFLTVLELLCQHSFSFSLVEDFLRWPVWQGQKLHSFVKQPLWTSKQISAFSWNSLMLIVTPYFKVWEVWSLKPKKQVCLKLASFASVLIYLLYKNSNTEFSLSQVELLRFFWAVFNTKTLKRYLVFLFLDFHVE